MDFPRTKVGSNVLVQVVPALPGVKAKLLEVLKNGFLSDVTFLVGQHETPIKSHKLILAFVSPVFEAMFYGPVDEASRETYATIGIPDIEPDAFTLMLEYIYARESPLRIALQTAIQAVYAARKYALPDMEKIVLRHLMESVTVDTAAILLSTAKLFDLVRLENKCWECIELDSERFLASEEFHNLDGDLVKTVISRENLGISELSIYKSVVRWGERECQRKELTVEPENVRTMIEIILPQIRFPLMEPSEFANGPARSGILTAEEISNVLITKFATVRDKPHPLFSPTKRLTKMDSIGANSKCLCQNKISTCFYCHPGPYIQHRNQARVTEDIGEQPESDQNRTIAQNPIIGMQNPSSPSYLPSYCSCRTRRYCPEKQAFT